MSQAVEDRIDALERAVAELVHSASVVVPAQSGPADQTFWLLDQIRRRHPEGAVSFGGTARIAEGEVAWQWAASSPDVLAQEWESAASIFDALSHPVRLGLLQQVLNGTTTTAELAEDPAMGTTGQLHHHLRALVAAGWLTSTGRGRWAVAPQRIIPLLVMVVAATTR